MADLATQMDFTAAPTAKATTTATFSADVIAESSRQPVLVHFLSSRSEACRDLQIAMERAAKAANGKVRLVTMDIDAHPQIAGRLGVRAVPAVYAFQRGQPVDGFMGALPEPEIKGFLERLVGPLDDGHEEALAEADLALGEGDVQTAAAIYTSILDQDPEHLGAVGGLARALVASGDLEAARDLLAQTPPTAAKDKAILAAQAALDLADQASGVGDLAELAARVDADPDDHQARFDLALGLAAQGKREEAADALLSSLKRDRTWNEGAARKQLLQFFEAWGLMDPVTLSARRKLSTLLFA
jgi:putative thioredoxin